MTGPFQVSIRARIGSMADRGDSYWQANAAGMFPSAFLSFSFFFVCHHGTRKTRSTCRSTFFLGLGLLHILGPSIDDAQSTVSDVELKIGG